MAEGVNATCSVWPIAVIGEKQDTGGAQRQKGVPWLDDADANGADSVIPTACNHRHSPHSPGLGQLGVQLAGDLIALE